MATVFQQSWAAIGSQLTITLDALGSASFRQSDEVDNSSSQFLDAQLIIVCGTTATGISSSGVVEVYGFGQAGDGRPWRTDTMGAADAAAGGVQNARLIGVLRANSGSTIFAGGPWSVSAAFGGILPYKWGIVVGNRTGAQLTNSASVNQAYFIGYREQGI